MAKQSTNKWALERARKSASALAKQPETDPTLAAVLSSLLWVVDHQQDQIEQLLTYASTKHLIEQALVDHARGDGTVQINESCHEAIKAYWHTDGATDEPTEPTSETRLQLVLDHIRNVKTERDHTTVPVADLCLLRDEIGRLQEAVAVAQAQEAWVREAALIEVQDFVVAHTFDTTVGRKIDDFITGLLNANKG